MTSGLAITSFMPSVISSTIFSTRRANSGADAIVTSNPLVGAMNMDIAGGQIVNAVKGVSNIAKGSANSLAEGITSAEESIRALSQGDKVVGGIAKVLNFTADHINPIICATSGVKVLTSENKKDEAIKEGTALGVMFASESLAKNALGLAKTSKYNPKTMIETKEGLFNVANGEKKLIAEAGKYQILDNKLVINRDGLFNENPFIQKQTAAFNDYCKTHEICNKSLKFLPGLMKGLAFAGASILGYKFGQAIANQVVGESGQQKTV